LDIEGNSLSQLPAHIEELHHLSAIYASDNAFTSLRGFVKLKDSLQNLSIDDNIEGRSKALSSLPYAGKLKNYRH
jgi:Leucine-rich repeat (LRR) protein